MFIYNRILQASIKRKIGVEQYKFYQVGYFHMFNKTKRKLNYVIFFNYTIYI